MDQINHHPPDTYYDNLMIEMAYLMLENGRLYNKIEELEKEIRQWEKDWWNTDHD
jgi:hypothetical protein